MKITFNKEDLTYATRVAHSIVPQQSSLAILSNILIKAEKDEVSFFACDMESVVQCSIRARVEETGETTVPAAPFATLVRELPGEEVVLTMEEGENVIVRAERSEYKLQTMSAADFPLWSDVEPVVEFEIEQKALRKMIDKTIFAVPLKDPRKVLMGVYLTVSEELPEKLDPGDVENPVCVRMVATDGKKLGCIDVAASRTIGKAGAVIIPHKVVSELDKQLGEEGLVKVGLGEKQIYFQFQNAVYKTNRIDGDYPNYELVIPNEFELRIPVDRKTFINAIKRASVISEEKNHSIIFTFRPGEAELEAMTFDLGSFSGSVPVDYDGEIFKLAFNHKYLMEALNVMDAETIFFNIKSNSQPVIIHEEGFPNTLFLVMPIKLSNLMSGEVDE